MSLQEKLSAFGHLKECGARDGAFIIEFTHELKNTLDNCTKVLNIILSTQELKEYTRIICCYFDDEQFKIMLKPKRN